MADERKPEETSICRIRPTVTLLALLGVVAILAVLHLISKFCDSKDVCGVLSGFFIKERYLFDLSEEGNIPTWFSVTQLTATSLALFASSIIHKSQRGGPLPWLMLSGLFLYLSLDEATDLHGLWIYAVPETLSLRGTRSGFDWVLPGAVVVLLVASSFLPWLLKLPRRTAVLFIVAGATYVFGGMGLETLGAFVFSAERSSSNSLYTLVATAEEALEMVGVTIMLYAVLDSWRGLQVVVKGEPPLP